MCTGILGIDQTCPKRDKGLSVLLYMALLDMCGQPSLPLASGNFLGSKSCTISGFQVDEVKFTLLKSSSQSASGICSGSFAQRETKMSPVPYQSQTAEQVPPSL